MPNGMRMKVFSWDKVNWGVESTGRSASRHVAMAPLVEMPSNGDVLRKREKTAGCLPAPVVQ